MMVMWYDTELWMDYRARPGLCNESYIWYVYMVCICTEDGVDARARQGLCNESLYVQVHPNPLENEHVKEPLKDQTHTHTHTLTCRAISGVA